jgi:hypothetical protein
MTVGVDPPDRERGLAMCPGTDSPREPRALSPTDGGADERPLEERVEAIEDALELAWALRRRLGRRGGSFVDVVLSIWQRERLTR